MVALAGLASKPNLMKDSLLVPHINSAGIYGVKFWIRGKPWVVSIDSQMLFNALWSPPKLVFADVGDSSETTVWGALYEKAWAKVKGSYDRSEAGFVASAFRAVTGAPVYHHST